MMISFSMKQRLWAGFGGKWKSLTLVAASAISIWLFPSLGSAQPQFAQPGQLPAIDAATQAAIIDSISMVLNKGYVFADRAARTDSLLHAKLAAGDYSKLTDPAEFMSTLEADINSICQDKHLRTAALKPSESADEGQPKDSLKEAERERESSRKSNFGFKKVEILPGNIGYLEFTRFEDVALAGPTAVAALNFLANAEALIIDLRQNGGGNASMIQLLTGYFFRESTHLVSWYSRATDETIQSHSQAYVPGKTMYDLPLYILISRRTFSAAEEFTYDLKNLKRAIVIGDTTGGGAHTVSDTLFDFGQFLVGLRIPEGRAISPITKTNWEGVGVEPDISVPADKALPTAKLEAIKILSEKVEDEGEKAALAWTQAALENEINPYDLPVKDLKQYVGNFGPRRIFMEGGVLVYQREGRPKYRMAPMAKDLFSVQDLDYFRIQFARDAKGKIDALIGLYDDGREDRNPKDK